MKLVFTILASFSAIALGFGDTPGVLCEGNDAEDFCDCQSDCVEEPSFCGCADAIACCEEDVIIEPECAPVINLRDVESPYSGNTVFPNADNCISLSCGGYGNEQGFEIELFPGETLAIGQTFNDYDSRHELRFGGVYPGDESHNCVDDPDYNTEYFTNAEEAPVMVYFLVDAFSADSGLFILEWEINISSDPE
jgi:hypothetical protein